MTAIITEQGQALIDEMAKEWWDVDKVNINKEGKMENKKLKIVSIEYEGFVDSLEQLFVRILDIHNVAEWDDLPDEYLRERPLFYYTQDKSSEFSAGDNYVRLLTNYDTPHDYDIFINDVYSKDEWEREIMPNLLEAGKRLSKILFVKRWCGKHILKI